MPLGWRPPGTEEKPVQAPRGSSGVSPARRIHGRAQPLHGRSASTSARATTLKLRRWPRIAPSFAICRTHARLKGSVPWIARLGSGLDPGMPRNSSATECACRRACRGDGQARDTSRRLPTWPGLCRAEAFQQTLAPDATQLAGARERRAAEALGLRTVADRAATCGTHASRE